MLIGYFRIGDTGRSSRLVEDIYHIEAQIQVFIDIIWAGEEGLPAGFYEKLIGKAHILLAEVAEV